MDPQASLIAKTTTNSGDEKDAEPPDAASTSFRTRPRLIILRTAVEYVNDVHAHWGRPW
jgi:hypothetical protein